MANETKQKPTLGNLKKWLKEIYIPWYERNKPGGPVANSNPNDPPPPPPGPVKP